MNFFKLYIGDYQRDTAHLSVTEHGAYLLMLQHYYATEKPLPKGKALHRMLRAQEKSERDAIDAVVIGFWQETDVGLVNERADVEITKAAAQGETNGRIAREREAARKAAREANERSTNRATNDQPNHSHSQTPEEAKKKTYSAADAAFERAWTAYPKRAGGNSKIEALKAFNARIASGVDPEALVAGTIRYAAFVRAEGNEGSRFVKQAATFYGPGLHYTEPWTVVASARPTGSRNDIAAAEDHNNAVLSRVSGPRLEPSRVTPLLALAGGSQ